MPRKCWECDAPATHYISDTPNGRRSFEATGPNADRLAGYCQGHAEAMAPPVELKQKALELGPGAQVQRTPCPQCGREGLVNGACVICGYGVRRGAPAARRRRRGGNRK